MPDQLVVPEAEAALIHALVIDPSQLDGIDLDASDFASPAQGRAFKIIRKLVEVGKPVDVLTLRNLGVEIDTTELAGRTAQASVYADMISHAAYRRRVAEAAQDIARSAEWGDQQTLYESVLKASEAVKNEGRGDDIGVLDLTGYRSSPPAPYMGVIAPEGTTVLYGEGGDGKGWIAAAMIRGLLQSSIKTAILDFENHPSEWAYRLDRLGVPLHQVVYVQPVGTMDKWANARAAAMLKDMAVDFLVVDSAMYASNIDDPFSPNGAMAFKQARLRLGNMPALLLAHTAKGADSIYGSVFWRNEARLTWHLRREQTGQRTMLCRKANAYPSLEGKKLSVEFDESMGVLNLHPVGTPWTPQPKPDEGFEW